MVLLMMGVASSSHAPHDHGTNESCYLHPIDEDAPSSVQPVLQKYETALLLILGFGGFSMILAYGYMGIRKYVFHDADNLDTAFDAGGNVSLSLTAVTVASQLVWPADLLQSATVTSRIGIAGPFWFTVGAVFNMLLFPILSVQFKTRAPGAHTFLQVMYARFGKATHLLYIMLALLVNIMVIACLVVAGKATIQAMTIDASDEFIVLVMATLFGSYSFIGGLGSTFYVSYFNAVLIATLLLTTIVKVFFSSDTEYLGLGDMEKMYNTLSCLPGPVGNYNRSFLTFRSIDALMMGIVGVFLTSALTFCDQAAWQSRIASKPSDGVWGFLIATAIYFSIPSSIGTTTGMAYLAMSSQNGTHLLSEHEIDVGLVTPMILQQVFGKGGAIIVLTMTTMALMSTGSGEVMAISSIIVYDIYQLHVAPFRRNYHHGQCLLCGRQTRNMYVPKNEKQPENDGENHTTLVCECKSVKECLRCNTIPKNTTDDRHIKQSDILVWSCPEHGPLRLYQERLVEYKGQCILWITIAIIPFGLVVLDANLDLNWTLFYGAMATVSCYPGVVLSILWAKTTHLGMITGGIAGLIAGLSVNLAMASQFEGGLGNFFTTTVIPICLVGGGATSVLTSLFLIVFISMCTNKIKTPDDEANEWKKTHNIDNPLHPWADHYIDDIEGLTEGQRPTLEQLEKTSRKAKFSAYIGGGVWLVVFMIIVPGVMASFPTLTFGAFKAWVISCISWAFFMATMVIIIAPVQEIIQIYRRTAKNKLSATNKEGDSV